MHSVKLKFLPEKMYLVSVKEEPVIIVQAGDKNKAYDLYTGDLIKVKGAPNPPPTLSPIKVRFDGIWNLFEVPGTSLSGKCKLEIATTTIPSTNYAKVQKLFDENATPEARDKLENLKNSSENRENPALAEYQMKRSFLGAKLGVNKFSDLLAPFPIDDSSTEIRVLCDQKKIFTQTADFTSTLGDRQTHGDPLLFVKDNKGYIAYLLHVDPRETAYLRSKKHIKEYANYYFGSKFSIYNDYYSLNIVSFPVPTK